MRLIVKGTGHDYIGRSIAPNSLSIWTHHMKGIDYHLGSFSPHGCSDPIEGNAVTARAGIQMADLYEYLDAYGETVVGGTSKTVGVGGYLTGGGHSLLSARNGLAADQVLEMEVVTPDGEHVVANEYQNEDIFWAMRGVGYHIPHTQRNVLTHRRAAAPRLASSRRRP
ncbi:FAD-binding protein [Candidatus Bathyarchaeota archaeon]|nr:FAD-binding protein [Candidatus Bathyarchaeota archaeon]